MKAKIAYILGSDSDFPQVEKGIYLLAAHDPVLKKNCRPTAPNNGKKCSKRAEN